MGAQNIDGCREDGCKCCLTRAEIKEAIEEENGKYKPMSSVCGACDHKAAFHSQGVQSSSSSSDQGLDASLQALQLVPEDHRVEYLKVKEQELTKRKIEEEKTKQEQERTKQALTNATGSASSIKLSDSRKTGTEMAKSVSHERVEAWWQPVGCEIKFNAAVQHDDGRYQRGAASRLTPVTVEDEKEDVVEDLFFATFYAALMSEDASQKGYYWWDGHATKWLRRPSDDASKLAPDGVCSEKVIPGNTIPSPSTVKMINDNKRSRGGKFELDDIGELIHYLAIIMDHYQRDRKEIGGSLYDGRYAQCFRLERSTDDRRWRLYCSPVMDCSERGGALLFIGFLLSDDACGWPERRIPDICGDFIACGSVGRVFKHRDNDNQIVKVCRDAPTEYLLREADTLKLLSRTAIDCSRMVSLVLQESSYLVLSPRYDPICPWPGGGRVNIASVTGLMLGPLKALHDGGFVHCDVRPDNIMKRRDDPTTWCLVDFGAVRKPDCGSLKYDHGTVSFASERVLRALLEDKPLTMGAADDLESLVRVLYVLTYMKPEDVAKGILPLKMNISGMVTFWQSSLSNWESLLAAARDGNHERLATCMNGVTVASVPEEPDGGASSL